LLEYVVNLMKNIALLILFGLVGCQANGQLKVGDKVPEFELQDQNGKMFKSNEVIGQEIVVVYFYPKDDTPGCTKEACSFRDNFEAFREADVLVIGISADDVESHKKFEEKYQLPFTLLADTENKVRDLFGVERNFLGLIPGRVTYVIDEMGTINYIFDSQTKSEEHIKESLAAIKRLQ